MWLGSVQAVVQRNAYSYRRRAEIAPDAPATLERISISGARFAPFPISQHRETDASGSGVKEENAKAARNFEESAAPELSERSHKPPPWINKVNKAVPRDLMKT